MDPVHVPVAGPSRPRRAPGMEVSLGDRIVAMQRRNAGSSSRPALEEADEYSRSSTLRRSAHPAPTPSRRFEDTEDYSRGPRPAERRLWDPSVPLPTPTSPLPARHPPVPPIHVSLDPQSATVQSPTAMSPRYSQGFGDRERERPRDSHRDRDHRSRHDPSPRPPSSRKLFDPTVHDPHHFAPRSTPSTSSSRREVRTPVDSHDKISLRRPPRTPEEEADRERERRRRKEGSERGSLMPSSASRRKDDRSKQSAGSRSSEGSESFKDRERGKGKADTGVKAILKDIHDRIKVIETDLTEMHRKMSADPEMGILILLDRPSSRGRDAAVASTDFTQEETAAWLDLISKHKQLADLHHDFLTRVFDPLVPTSLHQLTIRYNIPSRMWQVGFHHILERLRHAWMSGRSTALDLLTDLVYDAYKFYTDLLEDLTLSTFRTAWIEALGDLARYRMAIASHLSSETGEGESPVTSDDDDAASIGAKVAERWDVEDKETWRTTARDWYTMGITEKPGEGRLHHHLALLARDLPGEESRALHHFAKSLVVTHDYATSRESILPLFDSALQSQRKMPDAGAMDLFIRLHGMIFTRIELDSFDGVMGRLAERLDEDGRMEEIGKSGGIGQVDWMVMCAVNIVGVLQYGTTSGILRKALAQEGVERRKAQTLPEEGEVLPEEEESSGQDDAMSNPDNWPIALTCAFRLAIDTLTTSLAHPFKAQGAHSVLNPYITLFLTFLATLTRQAYSANIILPLIPWTSLLRFINAHTDKLECKEETRLVTGAPLPEDWAVRGMEWVGRRVYERGFWKTKGSGRGSGGIVQPTPKSAGDRFQSEMDVLLAHFEEKMDLSEGVVDELEGPEAVDGPAAVGARRWKRVSWAVGVMLKHVDGLEVRDGEVVLVEPLLGVVGALNERKRQEEERARVDEQKRRERLESWAQDVPEETDEEDEEIERLKEKKLKLQSLLSTPSAPVKTHAHAHAPSAPLIVPGYTMLVFDTNILLKDLSIFTALVESGAWSVIVPLPVINELDGIAREPTSLGLEAKGAVAYIVSNLRKYSTQLKVQTTRGNYLSDLSIRTESREGDEKRGVQGPNRAGDMDERILGVAEFQRDQWVDRSGLLRVGDGGREGREGEKEKEREKSKVVLVTYDRNLRLRAGARGVQAVGEKELRGIV